MVIHDVLQELHHMKQVLVGVARKGRSLVQESALHIPPPTLFVSVGFNVLIDSTSYGNVVIEPVTWGHVSTSQIQY